MNGGGTAADMKTNVNVYFISLTFTLKKKKTKISDGFSLSFVQKRFNKPLIPSSCLKTVLLRIQTHKIKDCWTDVSNRIKLKGTPLEYQNPSTLTCEAQKRVTKTKSMKTANQTNYCF